MNAVLCCMLLGGVLFAGLQGKIEAVSQAALTGGTEALQLVMSLLGGFMFFGGVIRVLEESGVVSALVLLLRRPLRWLFSEPLEEEALAAITENLAANMLGVSNAATPMGIRAAKAMNREGKDAPSAALCLFLVINATSVQLLPTSVLTLRYAAGSVAPERIILPSLAASAVSTGLGIILCKWIEKRRQAA
ncbi:MAG: hypothetical protein IJ664_06465 [Clostridia bacterium]|nr:hypothetical protein [Clostridia bacterium]